MKLIVLSMALLMWSCSSGFAEKDLGGGFTVVSVREDLKIIYLNNKRVMRGGVDVLFFDEDVIFVRIDMEGDEFAGDRGIFDKEGYFLIDKRRKTVSSMGEEAEIRFP